MEAGTWAVVAAAVAAYLAWFWRMSRGLSGPRVWPLVGSLPGLLQHAEDMHEWIVGNLRRTGGTYQTCIFAVPGVARRGGLVTVTCDPGNLEHVLKAHFDNYPKGPFWHGVFRDLLGDGIFNSDGDTWVAQRKTAALEFTTRTLRTARNFGFHWGEQGVSTNPCSEIYAGPSAFSEPESRAVRDYILKENKSKRIKMYLTLHSYGPLILYPWGYDYNLNAADDVSELIDIGNRANEAMVAAGSVRFTVENSAELYPASGASDDWSKGVAEIAKAYTIELPGGGSQGFDMPASQILPVTKQVFAGLRSFALDAKKLD